MNKISMEKFEIMKQSIYDNSFLQREYGNKLLSQALSDADIAVEPESILPDITQGMLDIRMSQYTLTVFKKSSGESIYNVAFGNEQRKKTVLANAKLYVTAPRMARAMSQVLDLGILGDVPKRMFERILRDAGADI